MKRVYFLKPMGMAGPVKIGCSVLPENRLRSLDIWSPFPLELLATAEGNHQHERALHWRFRDNHSHGEWFFASPDLLNLIDHVRLTGNLPPLEAVPDGKSGTPRGKNPGRTKAHRAKAALTLRISQAERHAHGFRDKERRPDWIKDAIQSWQGAHTPYPCAELVERIDQYIAELRTLPKQPRNYAAWVEWRKAKEMAA